jgi:hypothetical protein
MLRGPFHSDQSSVSRLPAVLVLVAVLVSVLGGAVPASAQTTEEPTPEPTVTSQEPSPEPTAPAEEPAPEPSSTTEAPAAEPSTNPTDPTAAPLVTTPTIRSDKADYAPGEAVILIGDSWQPAEPIHVLVNDDQGETWRREVDVIADARGHFTDQFLLPDWFVATYRVVATGPISGIATASFTDGNVKVASDSGRHFDYSATLYSGSTNCTGAAGSTDIKTADANGSTSGVGNNESLLIAANLNANAPNATATFSHWTRPGTPSITFAAGYSDTDRTVCLVGFQTGSRDLIGHYTVNTAPEATTPSFSPASPKTADTLQASSTLTDADGDTVKGTFVWKVQTGDDTCEVRSHTTAFAATGSVHSDSLDLSASHSATNCTGTAPFPTSINPSKGDTIHVFVTPNDGTVNGTTKTNSVAVANSAPTATLAGASDVPESTTALRTYSFTFSDPDGGPFTVVTTDCGIGGVQIGPVYDLSSNSGKFDCRFSDGPAGPIVAVTLEDDSGAQDSDTLPVTVANVAPTT